MCAIYVTSVSSGNVTEMLRCNIFPKSWKNYSIFNLVVYLYLSRQCMGIWLFALVCVWFFCLFFFNVRYVLWAIGEFYHFSGCTSSIPISMFCEDEDRGAGGLQENNLATGNERNFKSINEDTASLTLLVWYGFYSTYVCLQFLSYCINV